MDPLALALVTSHINGRSPLPERTRRATPRRRLAVLLRLAARRIEAPELAARRAAACPAPATA